ncbi:7-carboxy-7-deazaguanine synthase QueE [Croceicoccus mobilis]|uniref:7-carboxy-7-deazaguanine synthase n=1 Tax=Croceicoccus mobilis TaxID=1703339 RepID=A0A916YQM1_9SPHN|nr:7-carboxy-7-deazaguanine synthase QueE [Croceicoccus mobilis]GGD56715.1 7-carboxy-7-deazaguanine synthase [Croceicoccus mobilis]
MPIVLATTEPGEPEIFASLQGEGPSTGRPSVFVRLSRCNLACHWCDTAYTWRFTGDERPHRGGESYARKANQIAMDEREAAQAILALVPDRLVVTGGEPLLQAAALVKTLNLVRSVQPRLHIEVETNGTVEAPRSLDTLIDQYNVSPKLQHSGNPASLALVPERLQYYANDPRAFFKFVIAKPEDVNDVLVLKREYGIPAARVQLMPEGTDSQTLRHRMHWLAPIAQKYGLRVTDRLHIHIYGDLRGV